MIDSATQDQIKDTANKLVAARAPFSAWNVSTAVRRMGFSGNPREMIKLVHGMYRDGSLSDYQQTMVEDKTRPGTNFFLYHPPELDAKTYDPTTGKAQPVNSGALPSVSDVDDEDDGDDSDGDGSGSVATLAPPAVIIGAPRAKTITQPDGSLVKILGNSKGSILYIPQQMAAAIGVPAKGPAYMDIDAANKKISISATGVDTTHVDRNRNIRIGKTALLKAGLDGTVKISLDGNAIKISKP